jgi:hypothetical protein
LLREDKALAYRDQASVMWRIGLALYVKAGGVPWKLADADPETAYIGLSYAVRPVDSDRPRFVTCCSQVFDAEGAGLEFVAYDAHEVEVQRDNPFLSRTEMFRVMTRSMDLYRRRHAGQSPRRVMVHKTTEFKPEEMDGAMEALHLCEAVDLVQVVEDVGWRGVRIEARRGDSKGKPTAYPVSRGTVIGIGAREARAVDPWRRSRNCRPQALLPGGAEHAKAAPARAPRRAWAMGRHLPRRTRPCEDELEQ